MLLQIANESAKDSLSFTRNTVLTIQITSFEHKPSRNEL